MNQRQKIEATKAMGHIEKERAGIKIEYLTFFFLNKRRSCKQQHPCVSVRRSKGVLRQFLWDFLTFPLTVTISYSYL